MLVDTIRENFGIAVNHWIEVDFAGVPPPRRRHRRGDAYFTEACATAMPGSTSTASAA